MDTPRSVRSTLLTNKLAGMFPVGEVRLSAGLDILVSLILIAVLGCGSDSLQDGDKAPSFTLNSGSNAQISLDTVLGNKDAVVLVFYRGFF